MAGFRLDDQIGEIIADSDKVGGSNPGTSVNKIFTTGQENEGKAPRVFIFLDIR